MSPRLASALVLAGVFLFGAVTGGGVARFAGDRARPGGGEGAPLVMRQKALLRALDRDVGLERGQREQVRAILASHDGEFREIRRSLRPRAAKVRRQVLDEVRGVMRRDQLDAYQRFVDRQEARARAADDGTNSP